MSKTVTTLTALHTLLKDSFEAEKVLIIAPKRVALQTWPEEIGKWDHLKGLTYSVVMGTEPERLAALRKKTDLYIINRENLCWLIEKSGMRFPYDTVVLDELSSFKSRESKRFKALMKVRSMVKRIIGLTGTPSGNGLMDLWAEFKVLDMGQRLGRFITGYRSTFFMPDKRSAAMVYSYKPLPGAEEAIYRRISDITISMKAAEHLHMPELIMNEVKVRLSAKERGQYEALKKDMALSLQDKEIDAMNAAALAGKLSQMANGAVYDTGKNICFIHDRKLDALEDLIEAANGKPVLVAYWFKHDATRIADRLKSLKIPYGFLDTPESIRAWNEGRIPVALIHPASAGHGLNLQAGGSTLVWFGLTWSLELYQQCNARLYRQGQKNTVVIHHILAESTVDEQIMNALKSKKQTQDALIDAVKADLEVSV